MVMDRVSSYRDLPLRLNQWVNVVRWEKRPRLLLRNSEFLWHEGHTAHATADEAEAEAMANIDMYTDVARSVCALGVRPAPPHPCAPVCVGLTTCAHVRRW